MVRIPGFHPGDTGSSPVVGIGEFGNREHGNAWLAQSVERWPFKPVVVGSSPTSGTISRSSVGRALVL